MINRYSLTVSADEVARRFMADIPDGFSPKFNAAPTHLLPVITQDSPQGVSFFYWGAPPSFANRKPLSEKIINVRLEQLAEKAVFRKKLQEKRCLIPADGFYQWKRTGKKTSIPYRFTLRDKECFGIAGLWEEYDNESGESFHTFSVITQTANAIVSAIAERMPVILPLAFEKDWLKETGETKLMDILHQPPPQLDFYSVSPLVNNPDKNDRLIAMPAPPADQYGNLSLFD